MTGLQGGGALLRFIRERRLQSALLLAVFLFMALLNFLTPMVSDDYAYCFSFDTWERIESVGEIFPSMKMHREYANGRVVAHFFAQLFLLLPKAVFNVINALVSTGIIFMLCCFCGFQKQRRDLFLFVCAIMLIWYFTPDFGQVYLWLDGACNYSWAVLFTLLFVFPYYYNYASRFQGKKLPLAYSLLFLPLSLLAGAYSEAGSCAALFLAFSFLLLIRLRYKRTPLLLLAGFLLGCAGFLFMMTAPVELGEKAVFSPGRVLFNFNYVVLSFKHYQAALYCIFAGLTGWAFAVEADRERILTAILFFVGGFISAALFSFSAYFPARAMCFITVYTVLGCLLLLSALWDKAQCRKLLAPTAVLAVLFCFELYLGTYDIMQLYGQAQNREAAVAQAKAAGQSYVELVPYSCQTVYPAASGVEDVHEYQGNWVNINMAKYYEFDYVKGISAQPPQP